jgi:hypothetical protein
MNSTMTKLGVPRTGFGENFWVRMYVLLHRRLIGCGLSGNDHAAIRNSTAQHGFVFLRSLSRFILWNGPQMPLDNSVLYLRLYSLNIKLVWTKIRTFQYFLKKNVTLLTIVFLIRSKELDQCVLV